MKRLQVLLLVMLVSMTAFWVLGCGEGGEEPTAPTIEIKQPTVTPIPTATPTPVTDNSALAVSSIQEYAEVRDAAISQDGDTYSLVLVVDRATSTERAKELGDNFVRMVKSFGPDDSPGQEIGTGTYDYLIGVYYPDGEQVALGAKSRISMRITW